MAELEPLKWPKILAEATKQYSDDLQVSRKKRQSWFVHVEEDSSVELPDIKDFDAFKAEMENQRKKFGDVASNNVLKAMLEVGEPLKILMDRAGPILGKVG